MMRRFLLTSVSIFVIAKATAQMIPAQMVITPTTIPEVLQVIDKTGTPVKIGDVDPNTHTFTPVTGGGSGTTGNTTIISFPNHAALIQTAGQIPALTLDQQGYWQPGIGALTYDWNATANCSPDTNMVYCVLPPGQNVSTPGRYMARIT